MATVTGALAHNPVPLTYNARDAALAQSRLLAASADTRVSSAHYYQSLAPATTTPSAAIPNTSILNTTILNTGAGATVLGGVLADQPSVSGGAAIAGAGHDTIKLGGGGSGGSGHFTMSFVGGDSASTVLSGAGHVTIFGGGKGDTLSGGSGASVIVAGHGNSTLTGAGRGGEDVFKITPDGHVAGVTDVITNFTHGFDFLNVASYGSHEAAYVLAHFKVAGSEGAVTLQDGTKVVLEGVTSLTKNDIH